MRMDGVKDVKHLALIEAVKNAHCDDYYSILRSDMFTSCLFLPVILGL